MSTNSLAAILKQKNLWPLENTESWKYFDIKGFESKVKNVSFHSMEPTILYIDETQNEIQVTEHGFLVSSNLKAFIRLELIENTNLLNSKSKIDFRMTLINLQKKGLKVIIRDQKDLKIKVSYSKLETSLNSLSSFLIFEVERSKLEILEQDLNSNLFVGSHTQFVLSESKVEHVLLLSDMSSENAKIFNSEVQVGHNSSYNNTSILLKNPLCRLQQSVSLNSEQVSTQLNAFSISDKKNFSELRTEVLHLEPKTKSSQLFKCISADESKSVFNGRIFVSSKAQKTDAKQLCQGLILNPRAEINTKPELEIHADDVKAAHGAAIGQLGHDQIFYLISRGIKPEVAYQMLSQAFAGEVLSGIESLSLRKYCRETIETSASSVFKSLAESFIKG